MFGEFVVLHDREGRNVDYKLIAARCDAGRFGVETDGHSVADTDLGVEQTPFFGDLVQFAYSHGLQIVMVKRDRLETGTPFVPERHGIGVEILLFVDGGVEVNGM